MATAIRARRSRLGWTGFTAAGPTALGLLLAAPIAAADADFLETASPRRVSESKIALSADGMDSHATPPVVCSVRMVEGASEITIFCRHQLGGYGEVALVRAGSGARSEPPFWSAPLASPFEAVAPLSDPARAALFAGELVLRIDTGAAGVSVEGGVETPIFDSGFDVFSLCEWSNFPCPSDGNVCTDEVCSSTGVCSHPNNTASCPLPHATGGCIGGNCAVVVTCDTGYANCDLNQANGCETTHNNLSTTCGSATTTYVGAQGGDESCGAGCPATGTVNFSTQTGLGEKWYRALMEENSSCTAFLTHTVTLEVPPGVDWDLYLYDDSCNLIDSSIGAAGVDEQVGLSVIDFGTGSDDSTFYRVEVRYFSGLSCSDWTLTLTGRNCN